MSISSISSSSSAAYSALNINNEITQLEKQKTNLEKELQKVTQSKEDAKTKEQKVKQLQLQIQQIEAQIQQKKSEKNIQGQSAGQQAISAYNDGKKTSVKNLADNTSDLLNGNSPNSKIDTQV